MMKKVLVALFFSFVVLLIFRIDAKAQADPPVTVKDPTTEIMENLPFDASGVSCGFPNSSANKCCEVSDVDPFKITEGDVDAIIADIGEGLSPRSNEQIGTLTFDNFQDVLAAIVNRELTPKSLDQLATLYLVQERDPEEFSGYVYGLLVDAEKQQANQTDIVPPPGLDIPSSSDSFTLLRFTLVGAAKKLRTMDDQELLVLNVQKMYFDDQCLINGAGIHGFCMRGIAEFFAKRLGSDPMMASLFHFGEENPPDQCMFGQPEGAGASCKCVYDSSPAILCSDYLEKNPTEFARCNACSSQKGGVWTGVGCVRLTVAGFIGETLLGWGLSLAAIVTLLCIIYSAFILQTSQGNPERIKKAREYLTNCILGLLLILFSIFILRLVGVTILNIPGFS